MSTGWIGDRAAWGILGGNLVTLAFAWWQHWGLLQLLWPFWIQSVVIGVFAFRRIQVLRQFNTEGFRINRREVAPTAETRSQTATFFALHYGFFHLMYLIFLLVLSAVGLGLPPGDNFAARQGEHGLAALGTLGWLDRLIFGLLGYTFWQAHHASHRQHVQADLARNPNIGTLMFLPYLRVFPMHFVLVAGLAIGNGGWAVLLFGGLKIAADLAMHAVEHRWLRAGKTAD